METYYCKDKMGDLKQMQLIAGHFYDSFRFGKSSFAN